MSEENRSGDYDVTEDPWKKLSPEQRKRAELHLWILYIAMGLMAVAPVIVYFLLKK